jgi:hypothetical protein
MASPRRRAHRPVAAVLAIALLGVIAVLVSPGLAGAAPAAGELAGTFRITAGSCSGGASGSYFRMILPTGNQQGPWIENDDSTCGDKTYTLLSPGTDGGLVAGSHQPAPTPGFDGQGNSLAARIIRPVTFFGVRFAASTNATDLQTGTATPAPALRVEGGKLVGDLSAFDATWNKQSFNQGSPKPDGSRPGNTTPVTGTYDAGTGAYTLTWTSQIVGGPFNNFTGQWHLEGTFVPSGSSAPVSGGGAAAAPSAPADQGAAVSDDGQAAATPDQAASPTAAGDDTAAPGEAPLVSVQDEGFEAPVWLVLVLAGIGIGGVVALLILAPGRKAPRIEGRSI